MDEVLLHPGNSVFTETSVLATLPRMDASALPISDVVKWLLDKTQSRRAQQRRKLERAIEVTFATIDEFVKELDGPQTVRLLQLQADLRAMYEQVSALVPPSSMGIPGSPVAHLVSAISAARMCFWLRTFDGQRSLDGMSSEQLRTELMRIDITSSYASVIRRTLRLAIDGSVVTPESIGYLLRACLQEIANARASLLDLLD